MRNALRVVVLIAGLFALPADIAAQQICPCVPTTKVWIVKTCDTWNCAVNALVDANGDPLTFSVPCGTTDRRWVVIRRIVAGSATIDDGDPHQLEAFDGMSAAIARMSAIDEDHRPMIMSAPDGQVLVVSLKIAAPKRRATGR